jgi:iron complex transport system substrate-binding protein
MSEDAAVTFGMCSSKLKIRGRVYMRRLIFAFLALPAVILPAAPLGALEVTDALGRTVILDEEPRRIVLAGRGVLMVADALYLFPEAASRVVAIESITQGRGDFIARIDPLYSRKSILPREAGVEEIAAQRPDLVLMKGYMRRKLGEGLERLGVPVFYAGLESVDGYGAELESLGILLGDRPRADRLKELYARRLSRIADRIGAPGGDRTGGKRPGVLLLYYNDRGGVVSFNVPPAGWIQTDLVERAGGNPLWLSGAAVGKSWTRVGVEQIAAWDPDVILVTSYFRNAREVVDGLSRDALWRGLRAVREGRLFAFPGDFYAWDQPDPRWILGLTWLAKTLHPDLFRDVDMEEEVFLFFHNFFLLDEERITGVVLPMLTGVTH